MMTINQFCGIREYTPPPPTTSQEWSIERKRESMANAGRIAAEKVKAETVARNTLVFAKLPQRFNTHQLTEALAAYIAERLASGCKKTKPMPIDKEKRDQAAYSLARKACEYGQITRAGYEVGTGHGPRGRIVVYEKAQQQ